MFIVKKGIDAMEEGGLLLSLVPDQLDAVDALVDLGICISPALALFDDEFTTSVMVALG